MAKRKKKYPDGGPIKPIVKPAISDATKVVKPVDPKFIKLAPDRSLEYLIDDENEKRQQNINYQKDKFINDIVSYRGDQNKIPILENLVSNKTINVSKKFISDIIDKARKRNIDPYTAIALSHQETKLGTVGGDPYVNPYHVIYDQFVDSNFETDPNPIDVGLDLFNNKLNYAKSLGKTNEADQLQSYNGYGKVGRNTEGRQNSMYGVPIPNGGLDMSKNPLYGKRIIDIRDNILKKNPQIDSLINEYNTQPKSMKSGGKIKKGKNPIMAYFGSYLDAIQGDPSAIQGLSNPGDTPDLVGKPLNVNTLPLPSQGYQADPSKALTPEFIKQHENDVPNEVNRQAGIDKKLLGSKQGGNFPQLNIKSLTASVLPFIDAITNERDKPRTRPFDAMEVYNPHPLGTGSQAIYDMGGELQAKSGIYIKPSKRGSLHTALGIKQGDKIPSSKLSINSGDSPALKKKKQFAINAKKWHHEFGGEIGAANGGDLSASKAEEMLHDGTAHGKKLTAKQKRYFGMIAHPKADFGTELGGDKPNPEDLKVKRPVYNPNTLGRYDQNTYDGVNSILANGGNPIGTPNADYLLKNSPNNVNRNRSLLDNLMIYNQRPDVMSMSSDERINNYYNVPSNNPNVSEFKTNYKNYGSGPVANYDNSGIKRAGKKKAFWGAIAGVAQQAGQKIGDQLKEQTKMAAQAPQELLNTFAQIANFKDTFHPVGQYQPGPYVQPTQMAYDNGGELNGNNQIKLYDEGNTEMLSHNPYDGGTMQLNGPSHEEGGIDMSYGGNKVEAEGGETIVKDPSGNVHIGGNMNVLGTGVKFKTLFKKMAEKEKKYEDIKTQGSALVNHSDPHNKYERLKFNAGKIMMEGGDMGQKDIAKKKNELTSLQSAILDTADEHGISPEHLSKGSVRKAKYGIKLKAENGFTFDDGPGDPKKPSRAVRHNNPGNIKYGDFARRHGAKKGEPADDGGNFAVFPDVETGLNAARSLLQTKSYRNLPVQDAIKRWTNGAGYNLPLGDLKDKTIKTLSDSQLDNLVNTITYGEDGRYYPKPSMPNTIPNRSTFLTPHPAPQKPIDPYSLPKIPLTYVNPDAPIPFGATPPQQEILQPQADRPIPSNVRGLSPIQILPELSAIGANKLEPVQAQQYVPQLEQPYQVSFQDRLNKNQSTFNALSRQLVNNPLALSSLSANQYEADNSVKADEFRFNQGEAARVYNANRNTLNQAQMTNLGIQDQQYVRQQQAKSNTKAQTNAILNSITGKYLQNRQENQKLALYENLYKFRAQDTNHDGIADKEVNYNPDAQFDFGLGGANDSQLSAYQRSRQEYDKNGLIKKTVVNTPSGREQQLIDLKTQKMQRDKPIISIPKLFNKY